MAASDYNVADRPEWQGTNNVTAADRLADSSQGANPDVDSKAAAVAAGVSHPAYIGYAAALNTHQSRPDIEPLAARRLREYGDEFTDAEFMRRRAYLANGNAAAAPRPGTVYGDAPKNA